MPVPIKTIISILALVLCTTVFLLDGRVDHPARWVALALGPLMVLGIWIFPEPTKDREVRKEAARKHS